MSDVKKLTRSTSDRKIAGVCGGYAKYFGFDSSPLRIIFLVLLLCGSLGLWIYLISWLVLPEDKA